MTRRLSSAALVFAMFAAACTGDGDPEPSSAATATTPTASTFAAEVASSDLAAGSPESVQIGVFSSTAEAGVQVLSFGEIGVAFDFLGADGSQPPAPGPPMTARFVAAPGNQPDGTGGASGPTLTSPSEVAGVYITPEVTLPEAGIWNATVTATVDGGEPVSLEAAFNVYPDHRIPAPGDEALATKNLTIDSKGSPAAIDSRAFDGAKVPDPELHDTTIAEALREGRPALVQFATPVHCVSNFCGPTVEAQEELAREYADVAEFIHIEIWRKKTPEKAVVNDAAADWLLRDGGLTEPWLFLIDADGMIVERWGPLFDLDDVRASLDALRS
ncbi:MAG: hypothetical protein WEE66_01455 [Actinomycetota bacterium]